MGGQDHMVQNGCHLKDEMEHLRVTGGGVDDPKVPFRVTYMPDSPARV